MSGIDYMNNFLDKDKELPHDKALYCKVMADGPYNGFMESEKLGEDMQVINERFGRFWKPRYLLNHATKCAYEFINSMCILQHVTDDDIDWNSLNNLPASAMARARQHNARFPSFISKFNNGVASVTWQLNPDGRYYMDEDGYGMTDDEEINIYGVIDTRCRVIVKFCAIKSFDDLQRMKDRAIELLK
jgi:hypothetical protein